MLYVNEDIAAKLVTKEKLSIEDFYAELSLRKQKLLISCSYNPEKTPIGQHIETLGKSINLYPSTYVNVTFFR